MRVCVLSLLLAAPQLLAEPPKIMSGAVEIRTAAGIEAGIIIAVDEVREGRRDGSADAAYVWLTEDVVAHVHHRLDTAVVEDFGDRVVVSGSGSRLVFALAGAKAVKCGQDGTFAGGYSLARYSEKNVEAMRVVADESESLIGCGGEGGGPCYSDWSLGGGGGGGSCPSGGPGSTSCTSSCPGFSCSVSCGAGYYACCSCTSCKCVKG